MDLVGRHSDVHLDVEIDESLEDSFVCQPDVAASIVSSVQPNEAADVQLATFLEIFCSVRQQSNISPSHLPGHFSH